MQCPQYKTKLTVRDTDDYGDFVIRVRKCPQCHCRIESTEVITGCQPAEKIVRRVAELRQAV